MSTKLNSDSYSSLSEKYSQNQLKEAIYSLFKFKESLKKKEKKENEKIYIINNYIIEFLSKKFDIDFNKNLEEKKTGFTEINKKEMKN